MSVPRKAKPGQIRVGWGSSDESRNDTHVVWGDGSNSSDGRVACEAIHTLGKELERRGYDLNTLRFSIQRKATHE